MANNKAKPNDFYKLKKNIIMKVILIMICSIMIGLFILVFLIDGIFQDSFANSVIGFLTSIGVDWDDAQFIYFKVFMARKTMWLLLGLLIIIAIAFYFVLSRFTKYFDDISKGVDSLVDENYSTIRLSEELDFMEDKLNEVNHKLKRRATEAKEAEEKKNDLVVYLAHDIKTPLTSIIGYLNLIEESPDLSVENRAKYVNITLEKAYRLEELINEFFEITRYSLQSIELDKTTIDLNLMLNQILDEFFPQFEEKNLSLVKSVPDNIKFQGDSQKVARVFNNIIKNAVIYSHNGKEITVSALQNDGQIEVNIKNSGEDIPTERLDAIFEKFYRLDKSRTSNKGGSGLGLAIAKEIVEAHDGKISAKCVDGETTFTVVLPNAS